MSNVITIEHVEPPAMAGRKHRFEKSVIRLGRNEQNDVPFDESERMVSGWHAEIVCDERGRVLVRDVGSRNGTFVNERPVASEPVPVRSSESIRLGKNGPIVRVSYASAAAVTMTDTPAHSGPLSPIAPSEKGIGNTTLQRIVGQAIAAERGRLQSDTQKQWIVIGVGIAVVLVLASATAFLALRSTNESTPALAKADAVSSEDGSDEDEVGEETNDEAVPETDKPADPESDPAPDEDGDEDESKNAGRLRVAERSDAEQEERRSSMARIAFSVSGERPDLRKTPIDSGEPELPVETEPRPEPRRDSQPSVEPEPELASFADVVAAKRQAVMLLKPLDGPTHGTGFVISKKHRLIVTNAHVADFAEQAVLNETRSVYRIVRTWYHPDVYRLMDDFQTFIRSSDSKLGDVRGGADVAIHQLEMLGPDLPAEFTLADAATAQRIVGREIGMFGYPAIAASAEHNQYAQATFSEGSVSRLETLLGANEGWPSEQRRRVVFSAQTMGGFSGSPTFLSDGRVVAVSNAGGVRQDRGLRFQESYAIRIDAVWDLLAKEDLLDMVPNADSAPREQFFVDREPPPRTAALVRAREISDEGWNLFTAGEARDGLEKLIAATREADWYWLASLRVGVAYLRAVESDPNADGVADLALNGYDFLKRANAQWEQGGPQVTGLQYNPFLLTQLSEIAVRAAIATGGSDSKIPPEALSILIRPNSLKLLVEQEEAPGIVANIAFLQFCVGDLRTALDNINFSIEREPSRGGFFRLRAILWEALGESEKAQADNQRAEALGA